MRRLDLKVGFSCNNRCRFCIQGNKRNKYPDKSSEEIKKILRDKKDEAEGVVFTGGEPTFRPYKLLDWVEYARDLGYEVIQIQSNGRTFSSKKYCRQLINAGVTEFSPALHGSRSEIHDYLTRAKGSWQQTTQGIRNLRELDQYILTNTVITKPNYRDLPQLAELLVELGVDQFQFAFMHINQIIASDPDLIEEIVPRKSRVEPYLKKGLQVGIGAGLEVMAEAFPYCFMEGYENYLSQPKMPEADVYDADFVVENYGDYRRNEGKAKAEKCKKCKYYKICEGPWKEYPEIFGWDEFEPVEGEKIDSKEEILEGDLNGR